MATEHRHPLDDVDEEFRMNPLAAIYVKVAKLEARFDMALRVAAGICSAFLVVLLAIIGFVLSMGRAGDVADALGRLIS